MHVLQNAARVRLRRRPEQLRHLRVPRARQVIHRQGAVEQRLLQLEPQHDVHAVRELIRVDADVTGFGFVHEAVQVVGGDAGGARGGEVLVEDR